jgi:hypothetical protein
MALGSLPAAASDLSRCTMDPLRDLRNGLGVIDQVVRIDVVANKTALNIVNEYEREALFTFSFNAAIQAQKRCSHGSAGFFRLFI